MFMFPNVAFFWVATISCWLKVFFLKRFEREREEKISLQLFKEPGDKTEGLKRFFFDFFKMKIDLESLNLNLEKLKNILRKFQVNLKIQTEV